MCPPNGQPGQIISISPPDGSQLQVAVPVGVVPGMVFQVNYGIQQNLGDTVRRGTKKLSATHLNGHVGTVRAVNPDNTATVCVHGISGNWFLPIDHLTLQPLLVVRAQDAPG